MGESPAGSHSTPTPPPMQGRVRGGAGGGGRGGSVSTAGPGIDQHARSAALATDQNVPDLFVDQFAGDQERPVCPDVRETCAAIPRPDAKDAQHVLVPHAQHHVDRVGHDGAVLDAVGVVRGKAVGLAVPSTATRSNTEAAWACWPKSSPSGTSPHLPAMSP